MSSKAILDECHIWTKRAYFLYAFFGYMMVQLFLSLELLMACRTHKNGSGLHCKKNMLVSKAQAASYTKQAN